MLRLRRLLVALALSGKVNKWGWPLKSYYDISSSLSWTTLSPEMNSWKVTAQAQAFRAMVAQSLRLSEVLPKWQ